MDDDRNIRFPLHEAHRIWYTIYMHSAERDMCIKFKPSPQFICQNNTIFCLNNRVTPVLLSSIKAAAKTGHSAAAEATEIGRLIFISIRQSAPSDFMQRNQKRRPFYVIGNRTFGFLGNYSVFLYTTPSFITS